MTITSDRLKHTLSTTQYKKLHLEYVTHSELVKHGYYKLMLDTAEFRVYVDSELLVTRIEYVEYSSVIQLHGKDKKRIESLFQFMLK